MSVKVEWCVFEVCDIHGVVEFSGSGRVAFVTFLVCGIAKKDVLDGFWVKFVVVLLVNMNKCRTSKNFQGLGRDGSSLRIGLCEDLLRCVYIGTIVLKGAPRLGAA